MLARCAVLLSVVLGMFGGLVASSGAMTLPDGYVEEAVTTLPEPVAMVFAPDGRLFVTERSGRLRIIHPDGTLDPDPALDISARTCANSERGLVGLEVANDFALTGHVFAYWTVKGTSKCEGQEGGYGAGKAMNRLSRFTMVGDTIDPASEVVLLDKIPNAGHLHMAGDVHQGKDGTLYISVGDGGCNYRILGACGAYNGAARDRHALVGKILRINPDGSIPADNPYAATGQRCALVGVGTTGVECQETFAKGLRNPFRFALDPDSPTDRFFINDVGHATWEEVNEGQKGADYGWNIREGNCVIGSKTDCGPTWTKAPIHSYMHSPENPCGSVTGGAFVPNGAWEPALDDAYLFADFNCGTINRMQPKAGGGWDVSVWGTDGGTLLSTIFGPDDALYVSHFTGEITRIRYVGGGNRPPVARVTATPQSGALPLEVSLDGGASRDPDGDPLTYHWDFGDGTTAETTTPTTTHTFTTAAQRTVTLRVRDDEGLESAAATVSVDAGNTAPEPVIASPSAGATFTANGDLALRGTATDEQDGPLPGTSLSWEVRRHHADHYHPWFSGTGAEATIVGPEPEDLDGGENSYLEVRLTATDSRGLSRTVTRTVQPRKRTLTVTTSPPGLKVSLNERVDVTAPVTVTSWPGTVLTVEAKGRQINSGELYDLTGWSDGGGAAHSFTMPDADTTLTAQYSSPAPGSVGLRATYYDNPDFTGRVRSEVVPTLDQQWGGGAPLMVGADQWTARYEGKLVVPETGTYKLYSRADDGARVIIDGVTRLNRWTYNWLQPEVSTSIPLTAGEHDIVVEYIDRTGNAGLRVSWNGPGVPQKVPIGPANLLPAAGREAPSADFTVDRADGDAPLAVAFDASESEDPAGEGLTYLWDFGDGTTAETTTPTTTHTYAVGTWTATLRVRDGEGEQSDAVTQTLVARLPASGAPGLRAEWFDTAEFTEPKGTAVVTSLEQRWGSGAPAGVGVDTWSARFSGRLRVPQTGSYKLYGSADDGYRIYVDGRLVLSQWTRNILFPTRNTTLPLTAGEHELVVEYVDRSGGASLFVSWLGPGIPARVAIAGDALVQPPG